MNDIGIIGLGYVGLPLAVEFGKKYSVIGFDINKKRIEDLQSGVDRTKEVPSAELMAVSTLTFTHNPDDLKGLDTFIVTVPTPIDSYKKPDLQPLIAACHTVGSNLKEGSIVIFESTVFPGCTEEICVPILEKQSGLAFNEDFYCGYSPERINPGDKLHRLPNIKKVVSGSTPEIAKKIDLLYQEIITAGTFLTNSIKVAEAAKVIENAQRDLNIAFVNELALIFEKMQIDTLDVLEAAGTKWNFLPFKPGLVGGHCIGVDPYYLTYRAEGMGYHPQVILSGRRINDNMAILVASRMIKLLTNAGKTLNTSRVLLLGVTFKENCPDIRNSKVIDVVNEMMSYGLSVDVFDPHAHPEEVQLEFQIELIPKLNGDYDGVMLAVAHDEFKELDYQHLKKQGAVIFDLKGYLHKSHVDDRL